MWFSIWRPLPSWILSDMSSESKLVVQGPILGVCIKFVQIRSKMELLPFNWFQNGGRRHLGVLHYVNFDGKSECETPFSACVSNSVQMCAIMAELWPEMWFSIWRSLRSWSFSDKSSEGKSCPGTLFSVSVSTLARIRSKLAELWPFNRFQNGGRRHPELLFGNPGPPTKSTSWPEHCVKISCQSLYYFQRYRPMAIWKFCKFGLNRLFPPPKFAFWGFWPLNVIFRHRDPPKKALPWSKTRHMRQCALKSVQPFLL